MDDLFTFCAVFLILKLVIKIFLAPLVLSVHSAIGHKLSLILGEGGTVYIPQ